MKILELINNEDIVKYSIRLEKGAKIIASLEQFAIKKQIGFAEITAVGAFINAEYGVFENGKYIKFFEKNLTELISFNGNISLKNNKPMIHAHVMMSLLKNNIVHCIGGHLFEAEIGVTVEIFITSYKKHKVTRQLDEKCGLFVLDLDKSL